jgi:hypothetical protein
MKALISRNIVSTLGKRTNRKILVIESDDWGSIRMPSKKAYDNLLKAGIPVNKCSYNIYDSLETSEDIEVLSDLCQSFKDNNGNPLKVTANFIMANPDFEKIQADNFEKYHFRDLTETYQFYQGNTKTIDSVYEAIKKSVIVPQLHGREHLQVNHWLFALRANDVETKRAFDNGVWGHPSAYEKKFGINFSSAFHITTEKELVFAKESIVDASKLFENHFGFTSQTFIAPRFIWPLELESTFVLVGINALQGKLVQLYSKIGIENKRLHQKINWMGKLNKSELKYLIRNVFFEPTQKPSFAWEIDAMKRIDTAFFWGKPAVISMHRLNFMGGFSEENRNNGLNRLSSLIHAVLKKYPEVEFLSSNELSDLVYEK